MIEGKMQTKARKVIYLVDLTDQYGNGWDVVVLPETSEPARGLFSQIPGGSEITRLANRILAIDSNDQCIWLLKDRWDQGVIPRLLTDGVFPAADGTGPTLCDSIYAHKGANPGGCGHQACDMCDRLGP